MIEQRRRTAFAIIGRLLREHIWRYRKQLGLALICMVTVATATATNAWMMQPALDKIFIEQDRRMLTLIPFAVVMIAIIGGAANYGNTVCMRYIGQRIIADMQTRLFKHLMISDIGLFTQQATGRLISRFTNDISLLRNAFTSVLTAMAKESLSLIFLVGVMVYQNATLAFIALVLFPTAIYPLIRLSKRMRKISNTTQSQMGDFTVTLDEIFQSVRTVKSYNREEFETTRARNIIENLFKLYFKASRRQALASPMMETISGVSIAMVIWYGGFQVLDGHTSPGAFFSFVTAFLLAYKPVRALAGAGAVLQEGLAAANRLFDVLDTPPAIADKPGAKLLAVDKGAIRYQDVAFHYGEGAAGVEGISLDIPAGKKVALVGHSGGGKSTLMNLLLRFYDIEQGTISIDGQDTRGVTLHSLREAMAFVPQESMLFDDTVRANIAYGREGASEEDIVEAAKRAAAHEFIQELPQGYDTMIGAHGVRLSGGQRQRLSIARAMLKNAPILLLDEATSSLDNESERQIQQALATLMQGRTTLVIAHRLSTIASADVIYVIGSGRVIESGTHASLLEKRGTYFQLYSQNFENA